MSLRRTTTRRGPPPGAVLKPKRGYEKVEQGLEQLYPLSADVKTDMDIVFVSGLGAHPLLSFKSTESEFNWASDKDGIAREFPNARILLYNSESSWNGPIKVRQFLDNLAHTLLEGLKAKREVCLLNGLDKPIVFIGHSMGGLVIAEAVCIAESKPKLFPDMFESIVGCAFFGTPFRGAEAASWACMLSQVGEKAGTSTQSKLLELMRPNDEYLNKLRKEFIRLSVQSYPQIQLYGFYEQHPTTIKDLNGMPKFLQDLNIPLPKKVGEFVTRESAGLDGVMPDMGLTANHRDLVKFKSSTDGRYLLVLGPLKRLIKDSGPRAKARYNATRGVDRALVKEAREVLEGASVKRKRAAIQRNTTTSPWFSKEPEFIGWLSHPSEAEDVSLVKKCDYLWVRGRDGRGKTSAALSAIEKIEESIHDDDGEEGKDNESSPHESSQVYLAYYFCDKTPDYGTAEELLKSLILQITSKQELAMTHTKFLLKKKGRDSAALLTVENLWQVLQDILADSAFIGARLYFVINNIETLTPDAVSTATLLRLLSLETENDGSGRRPIVRWMFTSGQSWDIDQALRKPLVRLVDLEDEKYGDQVQLELRKHAQKKVQELTQHKRYSKALVYFTSSVIGQRAQNTQWIDITCDSLEDLPQHENDLQVRRLLEGVPQELDLLLNAAWEDVFEKNRSKVGEIKEMLRVLVLTYTDPTEAELGLLAGLQSSNDEVTELHDLVIKCRPLIALKENKGGESTVCFAFPVVKTHLLENAYKLLGLSEEDIKLQHGILGFRAFSHVMETFGEFADEDPDDLHQDTDEDGDDEGEGSEGDVEAEQNDEASEADERQDDNADDISESSGDNEEGQEEYEDEDPEAPRLKDIGLAYAVRYWLDHASQATADIAEALSCEEKFWERDSKIRRRWLTEHNRMTGSFDYFQRAALTGLHVAAAIGFRGLVSALLDNGYADDKDAYDDLDNQPLHFAAYNDKPENVEELLDRGANIDAGNERDAATPLGMAAEAGNVKIMTQLLQRGANPNAISSSTGAVICSAIDSGNTEAVKLLVAHNVSLVSPEEDDGNDTASEKDDQGDENEDDDESEDDDDDEDEDEDEDEDDEKPVIKSPLALAAMRADLAVFEFLLSEYSDKLPAAEYEIAFVTAAEWGRTEAFTRLFNDFEISQKAKQEALKEATRSAEGHWDIVTLILERCPGLNCDKPFLFTAQGADGDDEIRILEAMWEYTQGSISSESLDECLYEATDLENKRTIELLLRYGASANATGEVYGNALTAAAYDGNVDIATMLLDAGADIDSDEGYALQTAAKHDRIEVVRLLLERGADINRISTHDNMPEGTALQAAVEYGNGDIVDLLLERGADPNLGGGINKYPIIGAAKKNEKEIFEKLILAKADVNVIGGSDDTTALVEAAFYLSKESLQLALDAGADIDHRDIYGNTALILAAGRGDHESVKLLLERGADVLLLDQEGTNALQKAFHSNDSSTTLALVEHVSKLMDAMRVAVESGDASVAAVVRSVQNQGQELNYDDFSPTSPPASIKDKSRRSSVYGGAPPDTPLEVVKPGIAELHAEKIVGGEPQDTLRDSVAAQEPISQPFIPPPASSVNPVQDLYSPATGFLDFPTEQLFKHQPDIGPMSPAQSPGPIRRKPISGPHPPMYRPYQPGSGDSVRHSTPPGSLANAFQAYQPIQQQQQQQQQTPPHEMQPAISPPEAFTPPSHTASEPGFVPYAPGTPGQARPGAARKSSRTSFMGMKVPWSEHRFN
ncbi:hypothetical protein FLONG3_1860 [Fusarium longipes]|uniref:Uncharacterized protein n=1 Tax=Fusarium longipes TaxID=694270 RepID=A0A395T6P6_9HYPO|nr:hypothetical protein FLONG3_1860 [Fusarium longipes]